MNFIKALFEVMRGKEVEADEVERVSAAKRDEARDAIDELLRELVYERRAKRNEKNNR